MKFDPASAAEDIAPAFDPGSAAEFDPGSAVPEPRRGGTRAEAPAPYVPADDGMRPGEAGQGRGFVNPAPATDTRPFTTEQVGKDLQGGIEQVKGLGTGAAAFGAAADWRGANLTLQDFNAVDRGQAPTNTASRQLDAAGRPRLGDVNPVVKQYMTAAPEQRQALRQSLESNLLRDQEYINFFVGKIKDYNAEQQRLSGKMPEFTDVRSVRDFAEWAVRNGVATSPTMAASMVGALAGPLGLAATSGAMALGDMTSSRAQYADEAFNPQRFGTADRQADALAARPEQVARHLADNVDATAALAVPYAALDFVGGPAASIAKREVRGMAKEAGKNILKQTAGEAFNEGGQVIVNVASDMAAHERPPEWTLDDTKRVFNAAAVGGLMGAGGGAGNIATDAAMEKLRDARVQSQLTKQAAQGDIEAAVILALAQQQKVSARELVRQSVEMFDEVAAVQGVKSAAAKAARDSIDGMPATEVPGFLNRYMEGLRKRGLARAPEIVPPETVQPTQQEPGTPSAAAPPATLTSAETGLADRLAGQFNLQDSAAGVSPETDGASATAPFDPSSAVSMLDEPAPASARPQRDADISVPHETNDAPVTMSAAQAPAPAAVQGDTGSVPASELLGSQADEAAPTPAPASSQDLTGEPINRNWTAFKPESGSLGIPREQLPQISAEHRGALVNFLNARGITHESAEVPADSLKPTQGEFSPRKVQQAREFQGGDRSILVSNDGYVLDGHHQWLAKLDNGEPVKVIRLNAPIQDLLRLAHQFPSSTTATGPRRPAAEQQAAGAPEASPVANGVPSAGNGAAPVAPAPIERNAFGLPVGYRPGAREKVTVADLKDGDWIEEDGRQINVRQVTPKDDGTVDVLADTGLAVSTYNMPAGAAVTRRKMERTQAPTAAPAPAPAPQPRVIARAGRTPNAAQPIELRPNADGTLTPFMEGKAMLDFDSAAPLVFPAGISDLDAKKAIRAAGAVSNKTNFFPVGNGAEQSTAAPAPAVAPTAAEAPAQSPAPAEKKPDRGARAKARMALDPTKDSMLEALAKLGGIRRDIVQREFGLKPEELKHTVTTGGIKGFPFRKTGGMDLDSAMTALREAGYFMGVADEDVRTKFEEAIYNELGGARELTPQGIVRQAQETAEAEDIFAPGNTIDALDDFTPDELEDAGYADASDEVKAVTQMLLAEAEAAGIDTEALQEDAARLSEGQAADAYHSALQEAVRQAVAAHRQGAGGADAQAASGSGEDRGQPVGEEGEESRPALELGAQDAADLKAKTDREAAARRADEAEQKRLADKAKADAQRDEFTLTGSDRPADVAAAAGQGRLFDGPDASTTPGEVSKAEPEKAVPPAPAPAAEEAKPAAPITDIGEKIGGARKDTDTGTMLYDLSRVGDRIMRMGYERQDPERIQAARKLAGLIKRLDEGKITAPEFEMAVRMLAQRMDTVVTTKAANRLMSERERGADYVRERLLRARRQGDLDADTVEFALWALDQNPALAANLAISVRQPKDGAASGDYNPAAEIMRLFKGSENPDTAVHEIMHHAERMMPADMQGAVRAEWAKALASAVKKASPEQRAALESIGLALAGGKAAYQALVDAITNGPLNYDEHYQLVNPSEYWAVNASRLLGNRFLSQGSVWQRIRNWLREMEQKIRGLLRLPSDAPLLKALDYLLEPENFGPERGGRFESEQMLSDRKAVAAMGDVLPNISEADPEARALKALSEADELFALPKSEADTIEGITWENNPTIKVRETKLPGNERMWTLTMPDGRDARITVRKPSEYGPSPYSADFDGAGYSWNTERPGRNADSISPDTEDVWIDVSQLKGKGDGAIVYNIASTFAHNTGRIFIGDPNGVSSDAMRRRPQHMLASALKFGTTAHLAPHPDQVRGSRQHGVPALDWVYGDDLGNIRRLVDLNLKLLENDYPESKRYTFDATTGRFSDTESGESFDRNTLRQAVARNRGVAGSGSDQARAGGDTIARGAVLRALLREESGSVEGADGRRDGLLARLVRQQAVHADATRGLFYQLSQPRAANQAPPAETTARALQRKIQDQFNRFTVVRDWAKEQGAALTPDSDVWAYEERMHGRIATQVQDFREKTLHPKIKAIQKAGFTMDQVAEYLHAQHAQERNEQIESIDPTNKAGSGMETAAAQVILAAADPKLAALANDFRKITEDTKAILLKAGIINKDMTDAWEAAYKHYVPLKGGPEEKSATTGTGKGLSVGGKQKRALGHSQRNEFIIENILRDHERAIALAEKNTVGHSLLAFITELGNPEIATVGQPEKRKVLKNSTAYEVRDANGARVAIYDSLDGANAFIAKNGQQGQLFNSLKGPLTTKAVKGDPSVTFMASPMMAENEVTVYLKGHAIRVQLNDPLLARAYTRSGIEHLNQLMAMNREINAMFSRVYTGYNPEFLLTNMARDWTTGLINVTGQYGGSIAAKAAAKYPKAFAQMLRYSLFHKSTPDIDAYRASGGSTGAAYLSDLERIGRDVETAYDEYRGVMETLKAKGSIAAGRAAARKFVGALLAPLEHLNAAGENAMRLAVFEAVKAEPGYTVNDAASAAKNSTVNFNRRGEWGHVIGAMYLFFNPAIQGTAAMADSLVHGKHKAQAIALVSALPVLAYLLAAGQFGGGDDDDEAWEAIPDSDKDKSIVIRTGPKTRITIPLPYGYAFFYSIGNAVFDLVKKRDPVKVSLRLASNLLEHFSPIGNPLGGDKPEARGLVELIPGAVGGEAMRHLIRVQANRNGFGGNIVPDSPFDPDKPDVLRLYRSTKGTPYENVALGMSKATGGTGSQPGGIDVSPETLKYWTRAIMGGAGASVVDFAGLAYRGALYAANPNDENAQALKPEPAEIPILRRFSKTEDVRDRRRLFWDAAKQVKTAQEDLKRARKLYDEAGEAKVWDQRGELIAMGGYMDSLTKMVKAQRDLVDEVMADETTTLGYKRARVKALEREEEQLYSEFIREFATEKRRAAQERADALSAK